MSEQRTPDFLTTEKENELLCERLLRWKRAPSCGAQEWFNDPYGDDGAQWHTVHTPSFATWADAGLILEAMKAAGLGVDLFLSKPGDDHWWFSIKDGDGEISCYERTAPAAVRAVALAYIKAVQS